MRSYTHFLMTAVIRRRLAAGQADVPPATFLLGSVLPDLPLVLLSAGFLLQRRCQGLEAALCGDVYDSFYFNDPFWLAGHNLLHTPPLILLYALAGRWGMRHRHRWGRPLLWLALGFALHSLVDILTHATDGPLLFFPLDWQTRFASPISYWDPAYGGRLVGWLERLLAAGMAIYLLPGALRRWRAWRRERAR